MRQFMFNITLYALAIMLTGCTTTTAGQQHDGNIQSGTCVAQREWAGFQFDSELSRAENGALNVKVDMSRTKWNVGVVETWLESSGVNTLPTTASAGAVVNHESSNVPAMVGATGLVFDSIRNRNVGGDRKIGTAVTGTVGMVMNERDAQARQEQFDAATAVWTGTFQPEAAIDCNAKLWVRYWHPEGGVQGRKAVDIGHCFCGNNSIGP